jgi:PAS domain S-box-containing protein
MKPAVMPLPQLIALGFLESPLALLVMSDRKILTCSRAVLDVFGWDHEELSGQSVRVLYPTAFDYEATGKRWLRWLQGQDRFQDERFMQAKSGEVFWARATGVTLTPDDPFSLMIWSFERLVDASPTAGLTPREREVAQHIVNGRTSKEAARIMGISFRTVEVHRASIMRKLGAKTAAELVSKVVVIR